MAKRGNRFWSRLKLKKKRNFTTSSKLLFIFFLLIIPIYMVNVIINEISASKNKEAIMKSLTGKVKSYDAMFASEIQRISTVKTENVINIAVAQANVEKVMSVEPYYNLLILNIQQYLRSIQLSSIYIKDTNLLMPFLNSTISTSKLLPGIDKKLYTELQNPPRNTPFIFSNNQIYLSVPYINQISPEVERSFVVSVQIDSDQIKLFLKNMMDYDQGGAVLFPFDQNWEISSHQNPALISYLKQYAKNHHGDDSKVEAITVENKRYWVALDKSSYLGTTLLVFVQEEIILYPLHIYRILFWAIFIFAGLMIVIFSHRIYRMIHQPLKKLVNAFRQVERGELNFSITHDNRDEFGYLYTRFNNMLEHLNKLIYEVYEYKIRNQQSELKRLQAQINPHFLFNNYFLLHRLIQSKHFGKASELSKYLGQYFQFVTRDAADEIMLQNEVQHARTYANIQTMCYSNRIEMDFADLPEALESVKVPRLIIQPLIENCYKYALNHSNAGGKISVSFHVNGDYLIIFVKDNGQDLKDEQIEKLNKSLLVSGVEMEENTGLINVHRRLQLKYDAACGLSFSRSVLGGLKVELRLPIGEELKHVPASDR